MGDLLEAQVDDPGFAAAGGPYAALGAATKVGIGMGRFNSARDPVGSRTRDDLSAKWLGEWTEEAFSASLLWHAHDRHRASRVAQCLVLDEVEPSRNVVISTPDSWRRP